MADRTNRAQLTERPHNALMLEALCNRCGETFTPVGLGDLEHVETIKGASCGGVGELAGIAKLLGSKKPQSA
jgi:hypothetical protein